MNESMPSFYFLPKPLKGRPGLDKGLSKDARLLAAGKPPGNRNRSVSNRAQGCVLTRE